MEIADSLGGETYFTYDDANRMETRSFTDGTTSFLLHYSWTLRIGLACEIVFAALFHRVTSKDHAVYFADNAPRFRMINILTTVVDIAAYGDLAFVVRHA